MRREKTPWQTRMAAAGMNQRTLGILTGRAGSVVSRQLRGYWTSGIPMHVRSTILAWELMSADQRAEWVLLAECEDADPAAEEVVDGEG